MIDAQQGYKVKCCINHNNDTELPVPKPVKMEYYMKDYIDQSEDKTKAMRKCPTVESIDGSQAEGQLITQDTCVLEAFSSSDDGSESIGGSKSKDRTL